MEQTKKGFAEKGGEAIFLIMSGRKGLCTKTFAG
jgi:hypothetical protein